MQTKWQSLFESCINIAVGYSVALMTQIVVFPLYGMDVRLSQNVQIGMIFTVVSLVRSYALRRFFNRIHRVNP